MRLRRITTHGNWIPEIDGLRFVAIAATILVHIFGETVHNGGNTLPVRNPALVIEIVERGDRGVLLFFAISGFILAQPFLRQHLQHGNRVSIKGFFKRRLTRLEPPYILSLLLYTAAFAVYEHRIGPLILPLFAHIFYVHNFTQLLPISFVTWSLEVEVQFYILAPLLGCLYMIRPAVVRRGVMVLMILASAIFHHQTSHGIATWNLPGQLQFFLVGFLLADLRATRTESSVSRWWDLLSVAVWVAIFAIPSYKIGLMLPGLILLAYLAVFNGPATRKLFRTNWIALTGGMCYSFYLMHMLVVSIAFKVTRRFLIPSNLLLSFVIQAVLLSACIGVFCTAYFVLIERPCMDPRWPNKLFAKLSNLWKKQEEGVREVSVESGQ